MDGPTMETILQRLNRVERDNRRLKWIGFIVLAMGAVGAVAGLAALAGLGTVRMPKFIEAEMFTLLDPDGNIRAVLTQDSLTAWTFLDTEGNPRLSLGLIGNLPEIILLDRELPRVRLSLRDDGSSALAFVNTDGAQVMSVLEGAKPGPMFVLHGADRAERARLGLTADGSPVLALRDSKGKPRVGLAVTAEGPALAFMDREGNIVWAAR